MNYSDDIAKPIAVTIYRHSLAVRLCHWLNAISFLLLLISGVGILVAHPQFYWGQTGYFGMEPWLKLPITPDPNQTGWGRNLHFMFAWLLVINGVVYLLYASLSGHLWRLLPVKKQLCWAYIKQDIIHHLQFKTAHGEDARDYNLLQKLAYLLVIGVALPIMLLTGMTMAPGFVAAFPELLDLFGGRQSARTLHFLCAGGLVVFVLIHLFEIVLAGPVNEIRSMITGRYTLPQKRNAHD